VGNFIIGGDAPMLVQSMTKTDTRDIDATLRQIEQMEAVGCEIIRMAVPDGEAAKAVAEIRRRTKAALVADIHFQYRLALAVLDAGIDKLRINPGNIGDASKVREVVKKAKACGVPMRIGVNAGSLERHLLEKYGYPTPEGMVESALEHVKILEDLDFRDIIISLKASSVNMTVAAYRLLAQQVEYPFHLGITEAGTQFSGTIKSAIGLGMLIEEGIGDTIRVSLAADPAEEVRVGYEILKALEIRARGPMIIDCPTCGRLEVDLFKIVGEIEKHTAHIQAPLHLAVMGCAVNGPGEDRTAHLGVACGRGNGVIYRDGKAIRRVPEDQIVQELVKEIELYIADQPAGTLAAPEQGTASPAAGLVALSPSRASD
jgi:(E)-4-hydroxy-3-methylbut-2-enyl-diphosphate synthase